MADLDQAAPAPTVVETPGVIAGQRGDGGRARGLMVIAIILFAVVVVGGSYFATTRKETATPNHVASLNAPDGSANAPQNAPSQHYQELIKQDNQIRLNNAATSGNPVVVAPLVGGGDPAPPPVVQLRPSASPVATPTDLKGVVARRVAALNALNKEWTLPNQGVVAGMAGVLPLSASGQIGGEGSAHQGVSGALAIPALPLLSVLHGVVDVGANSDYPAELVARLTDGPLPGAKFLGHAESRGGANGGADRLTMRFTKMLYKNVYYDVDAIAVDAGTRIPAVEGDVNHHIVHNVVFNAGAAFLLGFASAARSANPYVGISLGSSGIDPYNGKSAIQTAGAQTLATTLQQGQFRGPTVTLPAGSAIGLVLIAPPHSATSAALSTASVLGLGQGGTATAEPPRGSSPGARPSIPTTYYTTAPDGTPITLGR